MVTVKHREEVEWIQFNQYTIAIVACYQCGLPQLAIKQLPEKNYGVPLECVNCGAK